MGASGSAINAALTSAFSNIQTDVTSAVGAALPYALGVMGLSVALTFVVRTVRKFMK